MTSDNPLGLDVVEIHGLAIGIGTGAGRTALSKTRDAYDEALTALQNHAWSMGADTVIGLRQSVSGASIGGMLGDASVVTLSGTAVTTE